MNWLETIHGDDFVIEVSTLSLTYRDRECIGKVLSISQNCVIIETNHGQRLKWANGKLLTIPEVGM